jgi:MinD-like ATPase involved in chromosome partitioning or flagellar assembly
VTRGLLVAVGTVGFEADLLTAAAGPGLHVVRRCVDVADLLAVAASRQATAALVSAGLPGLDSDVVARLHDEEVAVVGVVDGSGTDEPILHGLGIDVVVHAADLATLAAAVERAIRQDASVPGDQATPAGQDGGPAGSGGRGRVVAVWGSSGAPGRSTVALTLAAELAAAQTSTLLVDADVYGGCAAQLLGLLDESSGLLAAARTANSGRLSAAELAGHARTVRTQLRVLTGIPRADRWTEVRPVLLRRILDTARSLAALTVVDCASSLELDEEISFDTAAPRRNGATLTALESADVVVVVGAADPVGLGRLVRSLSDLRVAVPAAAPYVVVNRMRPSLGWSARDVADTVLRATGTEVRQFLPEDRAACDAALVHGRTLTEIAPSSRLTRSVAAIATALTAQDENSSQRPVTV